MKRRALLRLAPHAAFAPVVRLAGAAPEALPLPKILYSNDTTNILSCTAPWRDRKAGLRDEDLRQTIREAAGVDVHLLQPGLGWIPWWKSSLYSAESHYQDFLGSFGPVKPNSVGRYLLARGDLVNTLAEECGNQRILPFVSYRLNDGHHVRSLKAALADGKPDQSMSRFYWENYPTCRVGPDPTNWDEGVLDWSFPKVRQNKEDLITELCRTHAFAGLELDFLRHWIRFSPERSTPDERRTITTEFVRRIRIALDESQWNGHRRWLGVRVPADLDIHPEQGVDLTALVREAGIDFVNLSHTYFTIQDDSVRRARALIPDTPIYLEMTHTTLTGKALAGSGTQPYLRTTAEQFYTTAHLAYEQGATG
ncbi:MAG: hypothetical protein KDL87_04660, partial [Verrucomicrobiae bacterium]|nr:hypothetical protein [Verrucomicrobiae bacterium]